MSADPAIRRATYADLEAAPPHLVAEIIDGRLETRPRPTLRRGAAASVGLGAGDEVRVDPFDAIGFPLDALFPFDGPVSQKPSEEA